MAAVVVGGRNLGMQLGHHLVATGQHPASVSLSAMRAVGGPQMTALGEITTDITGPRLTPPKHLAAGPASAARTARDFEVLDSAAERVEAAWVRTTSRWRFRSSSC